jgi:hypothetical protein
MLVNSSYFGGTGVGHKRNTKEYEEYEEGIRGTDRMSGLAPILSVPLGEGAGVGLGCPLADARGSERLQSVGGRKRF